VPDSEDYLQEVRRVTLAHGAGGRLSRDLIQRLILKHFGHPTLRRLEDSALFVVDGGRMAFTTDSYVIQPLFFPGGDIGKLAVTGTVNDLLCVGAQPLFLSLGLIVEEGFSWDDLDRVLASASQEAASVGVEVLCGDTKVVERGKGDGLFINTSGVGAVPAGVEMTPENVQVGDAIVVTGPIGDHGIAVLSQREGFSFASQLKSDCASLVNLVQSVLDPHLQVRCLRDPTRGGLGTILAEIALDRKVGIEVEEAKIPVRDAVRGACELLGLDPLYVANEGKMVLFVAQENKGEVLSILKRDPMGRKSAAIGQVVDKHPGLAVLNTTIGGSRIIDLPAGELIPRIC
jgi:hydrogenase expression/formation protein HypE